jgi:hypothetical protein
MPRTASTPTNITEEQPQSGGSYQRNEDGSLTVLQQPSEAAQQIPAAEAAALPQE